MSCPLPQFSLVVQLVYVGMWNHFLDPAGGTGVRQLHIDDPPQLAFFLADHFISNGESSPLSEKTHFSRLYSQARPFGHGPAGMDRNKDRGTDCNTAPAALIPTSPHS